MAKDNRTTGEAAPATEKKERKTRTRKEKDPEMEALTSITAALRPLTPASREWVLKTATSKLERERDNVTPIAGAA